MISLLADDHRQKPASNRHLEMTMMLDPTVRRVLDGTPFAHLASVLPDGAPHTVPVWIRQHRVIRCECRMVQLQGVAGNNPQGPRPRVPASPVTAVAAPR
jgi:hypothetical protein